MQNGTVEMCHTASYYYFGKDPTFAFGTAVPFGLNARMQNAWMYHGGGIELMNDFYKKFNIIALPCGNTGCSDGRLVPQEIKEVADLQGLKMRIGGFAGTVMAKLGVVPQQIAGGEIYSALEKGTIDAAEWVGPYDDEKLGFQKIAPYYYYPGWWEGGAMLHNFFNIEKWNSLSPTYQVDPDNRVGDGERVDAGEIRRRSIRPRSNPCSPAGRPSCRHSRPPIMEASLKAALEVYAEVSAQNADFKKVWEKLLAFRNDQYLWWRVAEYTYDDFLIRNRTRT